MAKILTSYGLPEDIAKDLLATKPEKECEHKSVYTGNYGYKFCNKCGAELIPTPCYTCESLPCECSPLEEIEEIEKEKEEEEILSMLEQLIDYLKKR